MSERPTPEEIITEWTSAPLLLVALAEHGYVIVHADDVREREARIVRVAWEESWDDHRWRDYYEAATDVDVRYVLEQVDKGSPER